jgi:hypothetical protein
MKVRCALIFLGMLQASACSEDPIGMDRRLHADGDGAVPGEAPREASVRGDRPVADATGLDAAGDDVPRRDSSRDASAGDPSPVCPDYGTPECASRPAFSSQAVLLCAAPNLGEYAEIVVGTVASHDTTCSFLDVPAGCESAFLEIAAEGGTRTFGLCVPGATSLPPVGTAVSVSFDSGGDFACGRHLTVREASGALWVHVQDGHAFDLPEVAVSRIPVCHVESQEHGTLYEALDLAIDGETGQVQSGETIELGPYTVAAQRVGTGYLCGVGGFACNADRELAHDVVVVRRR